MDQADGVQRGHVPVVGLWDDVSHQLCGHVLPRFTSYSFHKHGKSLFRLRCVAICVCDGGHLSS